MNSAGLLLAAGESRRFGPGNKLMAPLGKRPLISYAASAMKESGLSPIIAVVRDQMTAELLDGFDSIAVFSGPPEQSRSLAAGLAIARDSGAGRVTVSLADMPFVTAEHLKTVARLCPEGGAAATCDGVRRLPPAAFDHELFAALEAMRGDRGAGRILSSIPDEYLSAVDADLLMDIDTPEDLARAEQVLSARREN